MLAPVLNFVLFMHVYAGRVLWSGFGFIVCHLYNCASLACRTRTSRLRHFARRRTRDDATTLALAPRWATLTAIGQFLNASRLRPTRLKRRARRAAKGAAENARGCLPTRRNVTLVAVLVLVH